MSTGFAEICFCLLCI